MPRKARVKKCSIMCKNGGRFNLIAAARRYQLTKINSGYVKANPFTEKRQLRACLKIISGDTANNSIS